MHRYLRPGNGLMEHIEIDWTPRCLSDRGVGAEVAPLFEWWRYMVEASSRNQKPITYREDTEALLTRVGFTDINHKTVRIPLQPTPGDRRDFELEQWFKGAMCVGGSRAFEAMTLSLFTRQLGYDPGYVRAACDVLKRICESRQWPLYFNLWVIHLVPMLKLQVADEIAGISGLRESR